MGRAWRVTYNLDIWAPIERLLPVAGRIVRLGGSIPTPDTPTLIGTSGQHLTPAGDTTGNSPPCLLDSRTYLVPAPVGTR